MVLWTNLDLVSVLFPARPHWPFSSTLGEAAVRPGQLHQRLQTLLKGPSHSLKHYVLFFLR